MAKVETMFTLRIRIMKDVYGASDCASNTLPLFAVPRKIFWKAAKKDVKKSSDERWLK